MPCILCPLAELEEYLSKGVAEEACAAASSGTARGARVSDADLAIGRKWHDKLLGAHAEGRLSGGLYHEDEDEEDEEDEEVEEMGEKKEGTSRDNMKRQPYGVYLVRHVVGAHSVAGSDIEGALKVSLDVETAQLHIRCLRFNPVITRAEQRAMRGGPARQTHNAQHLAVHLRNLLPTFEVGPGEQLNATSQHAKLKSREAGLGVQTPCWPRRLKRVG